MFVITVQSSYRVKAFSIFHHPLSASRLRVIRSLEVTEMGQLTPPDQRDVAFHPASCSAIRAGRRRRKEGHLEWCLSSQVTITGGGVLLSRDGWSPACPWEVVNEFLILVLFAFIDFTLPIIFSLFKPNTFLTFTLLILFLILL